MGRKSKVERRRQELLALIVERYQKGGSGWVPHPHEEYTKRFGPIGHVSGSGDAAILRAMGKKGLITPLPNLGRYAFVATREGVRAFTMNAVESYLQAEVIAQDGDPRIDHQWPARPGESQHAWEPPRVATKVPHRTHRLKCLGNSVCPQVAEVIGWVVRRLHETGKLP